MSKIEPVVNITWWYFDVLPYNVNYTPILKCEFWSCWSKLTSHKCKTNKEIKCKRCIKCVLLWQSYTILWKDKLLLTIEKSRPFPSLVLGDSLPSQEVSGSCHSILIWWFWTFVCVGPQWSNQNVSPLVPSESYPQKTGPWNTLEYAVHNTRLTQTFLIIVFLYILVWKEKRLAIESERKHSSGR